MAPRTIIQTALATMLLASPADPAKTAGSDHAAAELAEANRPQPGQYEASVDFLKFEIPGMPAAIADRARQQMARETAVNHSYCITEAQAQRSTQDRLKQLSRAAGHCTFRQFDVNGNAVNAMLQCDHLPGGANATMTMAGTMGPAGSDMRITTRSTMSAAAPGIGATMEMRIQTHRTGDCTAASRAEADVADTAAAAPPAEQRAR